MNKELRAKTNEELLELVVKLKGQMLQYRFRLAQGELSKTHVLKETRRLLAKIYTILTERKVDINLTNKVNSLMLQPKAAEAAKQTKSAVKKTMAERKAERLQRRSENKAKLAQQPKQKFEKAKKQTYASVSGINQPKKLSKNDRRMQKAKKSSIRRKVGA
ncbi:50S ribosomal protein L29 [[Mycoplasma] testudinis]|uniref:50S ribosomal protein L29 n=1 Tax=[Mycoplasma] testudinis TaxID=33924 RepID=UPI000697155D|nr:50S ribosomal protein L29 [[Mycoplasma] testudinis]